MSEKFIEGVKPGGLSEAKEIRILLCHIMASVDAPITRAQIEEVLLGEELVNYFTLADSLSHLCSQGLAISGEDGYVLTEKGLTVAETLSNDVPITVRETAVRGVIRAQQYAIKTATYQSQIEKTTGGYLVNCNISDSGSPLFSMQLYMPTNTTAQAVKSTFNLNGDNVYKLILAALTNNQALASQTLAKLGS